LVTCVRLSQELLGRKGRRNIDGNDGPSEHIGSKLALFAIWLHKLGQEDQPTPQSMDSPGASA
jgi:hypothetical protein